MFQKRIQRKNTEIKLFVHRNASSHELLNI